MHITCHFDAEDEVSFRLIDQPTAAPFIDLRIGESWFYVHESQLAALREATGEALLVLHDAQIARPKLTADEDGHSLRADQYDREQESAA